MDQRRFIAFLLLSLAVMLLFSNAVSAAASRTAEAGGSAGGRAKAEADAENAAATAKLRQMPTSRQRKPKPPPAAGARPAPLPQVAAAVRCADSIRDARLARSEERLSDAGDAHRTRARRCSARKCRAHGIRDQHDWSGYLGRAGIEERAGRGASASRRRRHAGGRSRRRSQRAMSSSALGIRKTTAIKNVEDLKAALAKPGRAKRSRCRFGAAMTAPQPIATVQLMRRPFAVRAAGDRKLSRCANVEPPADFVDRPSFLADAGDAQRQAARARPMRSASPTCWKTRQLGS